MVKSLSKLILLLLLLIFACKKKDIKSGSPSSDQNLLIEVIENGEKFWVWGHAKNGHRCGNWILKNKSGVIIQSQEYLSCDDCASGCDSLSYIFEIRNESGEILF